MKNSSNDGIVFDIKRFAIHDGNGIRSTLFTKGCPLRCPWCHNPEGISVDISLMWLSSSCVRCGECIKICPHNALAMKENQIDIDHNTCTRCGECVRQCPTLALKLNGRHITPKEVVDELLKDEVFFETSGGGVTISGGDPLYQKDFNKEVFRLLKKAGIHTTIETSLYGKESDILELVPYVDKFFVDIKIFDDAKHKAIIGVSNKQILRNFKLLVMEQVELTVRIPLIPGYTEDDDNIREIAAYVFGIDNTIHIELMNYNPLAKNKYLTMKQQYRVNDAKPLSKTTMNQKKSLIECIRKEKRDAK